jgi:hypothetical protein
VHEYAVGAADYAFGSIRPTNYPGGHMFYSRDPARQAFRSKIEALMK